MASVDSVYAPLGEVYNFILSLRKEEEHGEGSSSQKTPDAFHQGVNSVLRGSIRDINSKSHRLDRTDLSSKKTKNLQNSDSCMESYRK